MILNMRSVKTNYIYNTIYQIIAIITPFVTTPYLSRVFGPNNIGIYSYLNSILTYFLLFAFLGINSYGKREIARYRDEPIKFSKTFWEIELLCIISSSICCALWFIYVLINPEFQLYNCILSIQIVSVAFDVSWLFSGLELFDKIMLRNIFARVVSLLLIFTTVNNEHDLWKLILILSLTPLICNVSLCIYAKHILKPTRIDFRNLRFHFLQTMIYFIPSIATTIYSVLDKTMIQLITKDFYINGCYDQAVKLCSIPIALLVAMDNVMGSRMSYLVYVDRKDEIRERITKSISFVGFLGTAMVFGLDAIIDKLVPWFWGSGFDDINILVKIYSPIILCIGLNNCLSEQYLTPKGKRKQTANIVIVGALLNLFLNFIFIPICGAIGASMTSVFSELFIAFAYIFMCRKFISFEIYYAKFKNNVIAGLILYIFVLYFTSQWTACYLTTLGQIFIGGIVYLIVLFLLKDEFIIKIILPEIRRWILK